jgi:hypothetical protein
MEIVTGNTLIRLLPPSHAKEQEKEFLTSMCGISFSRLQEKVAIAG